MISTIREQIMQSIDAKQMMLRDESYIQMIQTIGDTIVSAYRKGNKLLVCGNGGSAADAQHIAGELVSKFRLERKGLPAIALHTNTSTLTAIGNDYDYSKVFERQIEAFGVAGDVLIGISTSGNSLNISKAFIRAKELGLTTVGFLGKDGGFNKNDADISIIVPSQDTPRIQEAHIMIGHIVCDIVEDTLFGNHE